ncbi:class I SAM-dependent methyltransferase [Novosphingobium soli]|uniref:Class I SAM-dependent methyltransferase n=1 Tax=Novosphingobium soli TaxID=574956 RepID=A0ABV6CS85_9SPHN
MQFSLGQRGRALMDFEVTTRLAASRLQQQVEGELAAQGLDAATLPEDMEQRHRTIDAALAQSPAYQARALLGEWCAKQHGRAAEQAFAEIEEALLPQLEALREGGTTITEHDFTAPHYWSKVWFHRTRGGWDAGPWNGFVHGELVHKKYVSKIFPGDIYGNRRLVLRSLPRDDYRRILEIGTSSGHHSVAIAEVFPEAHLTGIDPSLRMLEQAQRVANEKGLAWDLHTGVGEDMPMFADGSFDLVTAYAIHHEMPVKAIEAIFAEAFRVLEPGGDLVMADVARTQSLDRLTAWRFDWLARWGGEPFWRSTARLDMEPLARAAGFVDVRGWQPNPGRDPYIIYGRKPA